MIRVLVITNKDDLTTDFVINQLQKRGIPYYRLNTEDICQRLLLTIYPQKGQCKIKDSISGKEIDLREFDSVYYRRPEIRDYNEKDLSVGERVFLSTELYYSLEGLYKMLDDKFWVSPIYAIREAENKVYQLMLAHKIGFETPETILSSDPDQIKSFMSETQSPYVIKPVHNGRITDDNNPQIVYTSVIEGPIEDNRASYSQNYIQNRIDKLFDVRVTIVGDKVFPVRIESQHEISTKTDWRKGQLILKHEAIAIPKDIEIKCKEMMKKLRLRYAAFDFAIDTEGKFVFFEINPNGQWAWIENLTGLPISEGIVNLLINRNVRY